MPPGVERTTIGWHVAYSISLTPTRLLYAEPLRTVHIRARYRRQIRQLRSRAGPDSQGAV
jgi:hypothetical protein